MEDVIILGALAALLYLGVKMQRIAARRDVGQPWALHLRGVDGEESDGDGTTVAVTETDARAAVHEAQEIVRAAYRAGR